MEKDHSHNTDHKTASLVGRGRGGGKGGGGQGRGAGVEDCEKRGREGGSDRNVFSDV